MWNASLPEWLSAIAALAATLLSARAVLLARSAVVLATQANGTAMDAHELDRRAVLGSAVGLVSLDGYSWNEGEKTKLGLLVQLADYSQQWREPRLLMVELRDDTDSRFGFVVVPWVWAQPAGSTHLVPIPREESRRIPSSEHESALAILFALSDDELRSLRKADRQQGVSNDDWLLPKGLSLRVSIADPLGQSMHVISVDERPFTLRVGA